MPATVTVGADLEIAAGYAKQGSLRMHAHLCDVCAKVFFGGRGITFMVARRATLVTLPLRRLQRKRR